MTDNSTGKTRSLNTSGRTPARVLTALTLALCVALSAGTADARAGSNSSSGSRGSKTYTAPPATSTAPSTAAPMERSAAPAQQPGVQRPGATAPAQQSGGFFKGAFMPALMGGLIGAGIGGLLFGSGFFDGLGSFAGILGFVLQALLIFFLVRLAIRFFRNRSAGGSAMGRNAMGQGAMGQGPMGQPGPAYAGGPNPLNREPASGMPGGPVSGGLGGLMGGSAMGAGMGSGMGSGMGAAPAQPRDDLGVQPADFEAFERLLDTVQTAYGREDLNTLREVATPEMVAYFADDLARNNSQGIVNRLSDVRLLQGDLSEAWREGAMEYATVAMRFSLIDAKVERATGRVVEGDANRPVEATELWTFVRSRGGRWMLSAIQQTR